MNCVVCGQRPRYPGSVWCGNTCRFSDKSGSANSTASTPVQGTPLCQICDNAAFFDLRNRTFAPGCCRTHTQNALQRGYTNAR